LTNPKPKSLGRGLSALLPDVNLPAEAESSARAVQTVPTREIVPNPFQPRKDFKEVELAELTASIREKGVIQPLVVRRASDGYELVTGERRLRAAQRAGLLEVPVRVLDNLSDSDMLELSLVENLQRHDLNPIELAEGYQRLRGEWGLTQEQIAGRVGKERATVANTLRLLDLPEAIRNSLRRGEITAGHAKAILALDGAARQSALWKRITQNQLSVRQTEELARAMNEDGDRPARQPSSSSDLAQIVLFTNRLKQALGTQVKISRKGRKGSIRIEFYSEEDLERLVDLLSTERK